MGTKFKGIVSKNYTYVLLQHIDVDEIMPLALQGYGHFKVKGDRFQKITPMFYCSILMLMMSQNIE